MKKFSQYFLVILLSSLAFFFALQEMADYGLKKMKNTIISQWTGVLEGTINSDIIVMGSSRGYVSYDPKILKDATAYSVYNLSINASAYKMQQLKYKLYRNKNKKPKILIQNIDLSHFSTSTDIPDSYQFLPYLKDNDLKANLKKLDKNYSVHNQIPLLKYNGNKAFFWRGIKSFLGFDTPKIQTVFDGYCPNEKQYNKDFKNFSRLKNMSEVTNKEKFYKEGLLDVKKFIRQNVSDSIIVLLVWAPEYHERFKIEEPIVLPLKKNIADFASKNENVFFIDMSVDSISHSTENFYDSFHLNKKGAILFSKKLGQKIGKLKL